MNRLKLFISVGICSVLFSGCWFFTTESKQEPKQEVKLEPCDKMPEELAGKIDEATKKHYDSDYQYLKVVEMKEKWEEYFTGKRYTSNKRDAMECEILKEAWDYAKNGYASDVTVIVGYEDTKERYKGTVVQRAKTIKKKCFEYDLLDESYNKDKLLDKRNCYEYIRAYFVNKYNERHKRLEKENKLPPKYEY